MKYFPKSYSQPQSYAKLYVQAIFHDRSQQQSRLHKLPIYLSSRSDVFIFKLN
jgi:hypothetical protein